MLLLGNCHFKHLSMDRARRHVRKHLSVKMAVWTKYEVVLISLTITQDYNPNPCLPVNSYPSSYKPCSSTTVNLYTYSIPYTPREVSVTELYVMENNVITWVSHTTSLPTPSAFSLRDCSAGLQSQVSPAASILSAGTVLCLWNCLLL